VPILERFCFACSKIRFACGKTCFARGKNVFAWGKSSRHCCRRSAAEQNTAVHRCMLAHSIAMCALCVAVARFTLWWYQDTFSGQIASGGIYGALSNAE